MAQNKERSSLRRPLSGGWALLAGIVVFGVVAGLVSAVAEISGVSHQWAFALGWILAGGLLGLRLMAAMPAVSRRWRSFTLWFLFYVVVTVAVVGFLGDRIFAPAG